MTKQKKHVRRSKHGHHFFAGTRSSKAANRAYDQNLNRYSKSIANIQSDRVYNHAIVSGKSEAQARSEANFVYQGNLLSRQKNHSRYKP